MPRRKFVAGNWKMATDRAGAQALAAAVAAGVPAESAVTVAVCPPFPWLTTVADAVRGSGVAVGGQNCHYEKDGAYTGETSVGMLADAGCGYVIVGHSERRHGLHEADAVLAKKAAAAIRGGLTVLFCVGELLAEREAGHTESVLDRQLTHGLGHLTAADWANVVIAYEPVWAIGTGRVAAPDQAQAAHAHIRRHTRAAFGDAVADAVVIQYGGSVKPDNAAGLLHLPDVDGALVGGASLQAAGFLAIVAAAN